MEDNGRMPKNENEELNHEDLLSQTARSRAQWYVIDAADKVLGRVAVEAANILRGKNKTIFTPTLIVAILSLS